MIFQLAIREKPEVPPSAVAAQEQAEETFCVLFGVMWANKNFMILAVTYAIYYGCCAAVAACLSNILSPYGYTVVDIAKLGFFCMLSGVGAALISGVILDYTAQYRKMHIALTVLGLASVIFMMSAL